MSDSLDTAGGPRFCVQCGTALSGPFCYACGAAARGPRGSVAGPVPRGAALARPAIRFQLALPPLPTFTAANADTAVFAAAAAAIGFLLLAFPVLGVLAGFAAFVVLARRYGESDRRPEEAAGRPDSSAS